MRGQVMGELGQVLTFKDVGEDKTHKFRLGSMTEMGSDVICYAVMEDAEPDPRILVQRDGGYFLDNLAPMELVSET